MRAPECRSAARLLWTTSESADRCSADACFALAEHASEQAGPARLVLVVRHERFTRELGDARMRARKEERVAGAGDVRRARLSCMDTSSQRFAAAFHGCRSEPGSDRAPGGRSQLVRRDSAVRFAPRACIGRKAAAELPAAVRGAAAHRTEVGQRRLSQRGQFSPSFRDGSSGPGRRFGLVEARDAMLVLATRRSVGSMRRPGSSA
jgi:hypothetical protein